jgi:hypothetical protein
MKRTWLLGSIVALLSVLFAALLAEVVLHLTNLPPEQLSHQQLFVQYDSLLGWRNIPNARGRMVSDEYARDLEYNERSMRGPVLPYEKPAGTLRVLLLGDSFVDGYTEQLGDRVSEVLQRDLTRGAGPNVEVIPMGTGGYSTDQELLWLESEGLRYHPDVVVLMFHPNDVWYNTSGRYWRGSKPRFVRVGGKLELENVPVPRPDSTSQSGSLAQRLNGWVRQNSKIYWLVARTIQNQPRLYGLSVKLGRCQTRCSGRRRVQHIRPAPVARSGAGVGHHARTGAAHTRGQRCRRRRVLHLPHPHSQPHLHAG